VGVERAFCVVVARMYYSKCMFECFDVRDIRLQKRLFLFRGLLKFSAIILRDSIRRKALKLRVVCRS
jgi:hypothetical protein